LFQQQEEDYKYKYSKSPVLNFPNIGTGSQRPAPELEAVDEEERRRNSVDN
jgi:hypothetical protein